MMIRSRIRARYRRTDRQAELLSWRDDLFAEAHFENGLARAGAVFAPTFGGEHAAHWVGGVTERLEALKETFVRDDERSRRPFPPELLEQVMEARREKIRNKTKERLRERRGEVLEATLRRRRLGYPAHVSARWSEQQKREMEIVRRSASKVGYVAMLKRKMGWGIAEEKELSGEVKERVELMEAEVTKETMKRRERAAPDQGKEEMQAE